MNSLNGAENCKDINESQYCKSENWMKTEFDEYVLGHWKSPNENNIV